MRPGEFEIHGDETGRVWRAHIAQQLSLAGSGERRKGIAADGEEVLLHTLRKEEMYADDLARAQGRRRHRPDPGDPRLSAHLPTRRYERKQLRADAGLGVG